MGGHSTRIEQQARPEGAQEAQEGKYGGFIHRHHKAGKGLKEGHQQSRHNGIGSIYKYVPHASFAVEQGCYCPVCTAPQQHCNGCSESSAYNIYPSRIRRHYIKAESAKLLEKNLRDDVKRQHGKAYA